MLELRREFPKVLRWLTQGSGAVVRLTYRGRAIADLTPVRPEGQRPATDDAFYQICAMAAKGASLTNDEMDAAVYGKAEGAD